MIEPVFEELAHAKARQGGEGKIAFVKVDLGVGMGGALAKEYGVSATPTFEFFLDKKKVCIFDFVGILPRYTTDFNVVCRCMNSRVSMRLS